MEEMQRTRELEGVSASCKAAQRVSPAARSCLAQQLSVQDPSEADADSPALPSAVTYPPGFPAWQRAFLASENLKALAWCSRVTTSYPCPITCVDDCF